MKINLINLRLGVYYIVALFLVPATHAYELSTGERVFCEVDWEGVEIRVEEQYVGNSELGDRRPRLWGSAAIIRYPEGGKPIIVFDKGVMADVRDLLPLATDFIFYHECAHIRYKTDDEFYTNCRAVVDMYDNGFLDLRKFYLLEKYHKTMRLLPPKYGGAGFVFWEKTKRCLRKIRHPLVVGLLQN